MQIERTFGALTGVDFDELAYIIKTAYPVYRAPVVAGRIHYSNTLQLQQVVQPALEAFKEHLFLRNASGVMERWAAAAGDAKAAARAVPGAAGSAMSASTTETVAAYTIPRDRAIERELPRNVQVLLLAAFCASTNPPETDARMFRRKGVQKQRNKTDQRTKEGLARAKRAAFLAGPKVFTHDRLIQIYFCLMFSMGDDISLDDTDLMRAVNILCKLGLLTRMGHTKGDTVDLGRYQCGVTFTEAFNLAAANGIDLRVHIYDPAA